MKVLFEEVAYSQEKLAGILPENLLSPLSNNKAKTTYVGYYNAGEPIMIFPKVFIDENNKAFGKLSDVSSVLDLDKLSDFPELEPGDAGILYRLSYWIYQAISHYKESSRLDTSIISSQDIQEVTTIGDYGCATFLDVVLSLNQFNKDHQSLFAFIANNNRGGARKVNWSKTIHKITPVLQHGNPVYLEFVNKSKVFNFDEDLIVLFYSVLDYLKEKFYLDSVINYNYNLLSPDKIENLIETGQGTILLNKIRHKYFTDELVALWKLMYVFFEKSENVNNKGQHPEELLASSFEIVFENMIDQMISDPQFDTLKKNKDGKIIDHLYADESLINNGKIYYIADSKYYKESHDLSESSVYKQFTYAKNIIQHNLNEYHNGNPASKAMRDSLTEGYNIIPNFFIRGSAVSEGKLLDYEDNNPLVSKFDEDRSDRNNHMVNYHFVNRLFDRDTIVLQTYNINFLFVLSQYVSGEDKALKAKIHRQFRTDILKRVDRLYQFLKLTPREGLELKTLVNSNFRDLLGRSICPSPESNYLICAFERDGMTLDPEATEYNIGSVEDFKSRMDAAGFIVEGYKLPDLEP